MSHLNRAPVIAEHDLQNLTVHGALPPGLTGTLYRNGPNPLNEAATPHWFFGDGMVHAFHIRDGQVSYRNRWVRTQYWARGTGEAAEGLPDGVANTSVLAHGGALLALEEAHLPVSLDAASLATLGTEDFGGALPPGPFTAHPKTCPATGNLVFFGYGADGFFSNTIRLGEITPSGELLWLEKITAPYGAMIHDFVVTARVIAIPLFPLIIDAARGAIDWQPERGGYLGLIDRAIGVASLRWVPAPPGFAFHMANAWDEAGMLTIDLMRAEAPQFFPAADGTQPAATESYLTRWQLDLAAPTPRITETRLTAAEGEFPRIDERFAGIRNRHVFYSSGAALCARDDLTGRETKFPLPLGDGISEPVFVPRGDSDGDGWLLAMIFRAASGTSDMAVFDARHVAAGPVALARLPVRVPDGFHGTWVGDAS
jgi:carotenoid cleavage dioxygenase